MRAQHNISDGGTQKVIWEYKKIPSSGRYCSMDSLAWLKDIAASNKSITEIAPAINISLPQIGILPTNIGTKASNFSTENPITINSYSFHINISNTIINISSPIETLPAGNIEAYSKLKNNSRLVIKPIWPNEGSILPVNVPIKFNFSVTHIDKIPICKLFIDDAEVDQKNRSRCINVNSDNELVSKFNEIGMHSWKVECCDCQDLCNSSSKVFFYIKANPKNNTTYVNKDLPEPSRFVYASTK